jgi:hypothetical protein
MCNNSHVSIDKWPQRLREEYLTTPSKGGIRTIKCDLFVINIYLGILKTIFDHLRKDKTRWKLAVPNQSP